MLGFIFLMVVLVVFFICVMICKSDTRCEHIKSSLLKDLYFEVDFIKAKTDGLP